MNELGEIKKTLCNETFARFEWIIPKISGLEDTKIDYYKSSPKIITVPDLLWNCGITYFLQEGGISFYIKKCTIDLSKTVIRIAVGIRGREGEEEMIERGEILHSSSYFLPFACRRRLSNTIIISFTFWYDATPVEDFCTLQKHLQDLLLTADDHDVTIKVGNREFKAHKNMLRARSPVFSAMFEHKMKESTNNSISIEDCDPDAFEEFLKYVYTGKVDLSPSKAVGLYRIADKYDFSGLKEICVKFLKDSLSTTVICNVIALATDHGEDDLLKCATTFFEKNVTQILTTVEWQCFGKANFIAANELCLKAFESLQKKLNQAMSRSDGSVS